MYENIIGQENVVGRLISEIRRNVLPGSILFYGEPFTGKLSAAIETARALTCENGRAEWSCSCSACVRQRLMEHGGVLLMGPKDFLADIAASAEVLMRTRQNAAQFMYYRSVKKLVRRFDSVLWEGAETRIKSILESLSTIEDTLSTVEPGATLPESRVLSKRLEDIHKKSTAIVKSGVLDSISVNQIRNASFWAHTSSTAKRRIIIIEGAHRMLDSARNALLKILEEPPKDVYFILSTRRRGAIIPTILSRLRPYHFMPRTDAQTAEILERIFRESDCEYTSLRDYFLAWNDLNPESLKNESAAFIQAIIQNSEEHIEQERVLERAKDIISDPDALRPFLEEISGYCRELLRSQGGKEAGMGIGRLEQWNQAIRECMLRHEQFNQNPSLLVESLFYSLKDS